MKKIIYVDIDGTICSENLNSGDYTQAKPYKNRIKQINKLYDEGHTIIYWTARGASTGKDWRKVTKQQLKTWEVKYHKLLFNKPYYDILICNRAFNDKEWFK